MRLVKKKNTKYSGSFPNGHSPKRTVLQTAALSNPFFSTPKQTLYFYIPVSGQLQLGAPFSRPEGVRTRASTVYHVLD